MFSLTRNFTVIALAEYTVLKIFHLSQKNRVWREIFHCNEYIFYHSGLLCNLRLPWKTELPWNFSLYEIHTFFVIQDFWATCACPENFRCNEILCIIQDFWATCAWPNKESCPGIFRCIETLFAIQDFWATCACPENRVCPEFTVLKVYFLAFRIFERLALALKKRVALKSFYFIEIFFIIHDLWAR